MNVELDLHIITNYDADGGMTIEGLENCPPCLTYYDLGDQMKNYLQKTFLEKVEKGAATKTALVEQGDASAAKAYQQNLRQRFVDALGGLPETDCELNPVLAPPISCETYTIQPLTFTPRQNVYATANLYLPNGVAESGAKTPAALFVCGHSPLAKAFEKYQNVCQTLARAGFVVLALDPVGQGERFSYYNPATKGTDIPPCCPEHDYVGAQALLVGDSIARYFLHDARRAVDYLCSLPYVDASRIAVVGNSGGGTQTGLMMLGDDRIAAAAIGTVVTGLPENMSTGIAVDAEQVWNGLVQYGFDHDDIMIAMAPKPVIVLAAEYDYFPIEGTRRTTESAKRFYELLGSRDNLQLFSHPVKHGFSPEMANATAEFFTKHLFNGARPQTLSQATPLQSATLQATAAGQVRAQYPNAVFIFEENLKRYDQLPKATKAEAKAWLKERVNYNRKPVPFNIRRFGNVKISELRAETILYWSNENVFNNILYLTPDGTPEDAQLPVSLAIWDGGSKTLAPHLAWIRETCQSGRAAAILDVTGTGPLKPNRVNTMPMNRFEGTFCEFSHIAIWQNDSLPALWTWDVLRALQMFKEVLNVDDIWLYCHGRFGMYGAMANFILDNVHKITVENAAPSMTDIVQSRLYDEYDIMSHVMPGMLKYFDYTSLSRP